MQKIKIFDQEVKDNVAELVSTQASIAYCSEALHTSRTPVIPKALAENKDQLDLYYLEAVLVSTGWNKNDDVFSKDQTWAARNTPEDKQFNYMHDEDNIIGHITGSYVVDKNGNRITADDGIIPEHDFDIITQAVIYNNWIKENNASRMQQIIAEIEEGNKWFVSMECLFSGFDYALMSPDKKATILPRDEATAFLTKHLRAYGGDGVYEGYKLGRVLRNIAFSGKGLVSNPANPESVILNKKNSVTVSFVTADISTDFNIGDSQMSDVEKIRSEQIQTLKEDLKAAQEDLKNAKAEAEAAKDEEFKTTKANLENDIQEKEQVIAERDQTITGLEESIATLKQELEDAKALETQLEEVKAELAEAKDWMDKKKEEDKKKKRMAQLVEAGVADEDVEGSYASFESLDDAAFEAVVALLKNGAKASDDKDADDKKKEEKNKSEAELNQSDFDELKTSEASLSEETDETSEQEKTRASIAEWFETSVFNSSK